MDIITHVFIGGILGAASQNNQKDLLLVTAFSVLPDFTQLPLYLYIGHQYKRLLWIPQNSDWLRHHFRTKHPAWSALWEAPHSLLFLLFVITPLVFAFHLPLMCILAYFSHIFVDLYTHTTEWGVKPFYPFSYTFHGLTDVWAWKLNSLLLLWVCCIIVFSAVKLYLYVQ